MIFLRNTVGLLRIGRDGFGGSWKELGVGVGTRSSAGQRQLHFFGLLTCVVNNYTFEFRNIFRAKTNRTKNMIDICHQVRHVAVQALDCATVRPTDVARHRHSPPRLLAYAYIYGTSWQPPCNALRRVLMPKESPISICSCDSLLTTSRLFETE